MSVRVFVAVDIPDEVRQAIARLTGALRTACPGAGWVRVEGMHVTLKFVGEASPEKVERIIAELGAVRSADPVAIDFRNIGFFPTARHPRVLWAGIEATPNLAELAAEIEQRLETLGIPREQRPFRPHLTLARFKSEDGLPQLRETLAKLAPFEFGSTRTREFHLFQSRLKPGGAEYTKLRTFAFAGGE